MQEQCVQNMWRSIPIISWRKLCVSSFKCTDHACCRLPDLILEIALSVQVLTYHYNSTLMKPSTKVLSLAALVLFLISCGGQKSVTQSDNSATTSSTQVNAAFKATDWLPEPPQEAYRMDLFVIGSVSTDETYGLTPENAVRTGGGHASGVRNEHRYLRSLTGPYGEELTYNRLGSCCHFETPNGMGGIGLLDMYEVTYEGLKEPIIIYLDLYDYAPLQAPVGFKIRFEQ